MRDAVLRLADAGFVEIERNRGVRIRGLAVADICGIFETRILLEVPAAARAAEQGGSALVARLHAELDAMRAAIDSDDQHEFLTHDRRLHAEILATTGNLRLVAIVDRLRDATQSMGASTMNRSRGLREIELEHVPIVVAIEQGDSDLAARSMREHLVRTGLLLIDDVATASGEPAPGDWPEALLRTLRSAGLP